MSHKFLYIKLTPEQRGCHFKAHTKLQKPPKNKVYHNKRHSPVRAVAEYEEMGGVLISYPGTLAPPKDDSQAPPSGPRSFGIPNELIVRMQQNDSKDPVHIFVMCEDLSQKEIIVKNMEETAEDLNLTFNPDHLHIIEWDTDTFWTRDFGPWWIYNKTTGYYGIAKHSYTTLGGGGVGLVEGAENVNPEEGLGIFRPNDDYGAVKVSDYLNGPIKAWNKAQWLTSEHKGRKEYTKLDPIKDHNWFFLGLLEVGGNYMVTSDGKLASSYLTAVQNELPVTHEEKITDPSAKIIEERMEYILDQFNRFMGITEYHVSTDPSGTYIGHIDCWGKFLSDKTVLIAESENKHANKGFDEISKSFKKMGFEVHRVMCQNLFVPNALPPTATTAAYTNSLILNDHAYVPMSGIKEYDLKALLAYKKAMPDHTIIGITGKEDFPWLGTDAMHCRTRGIPREVVNNWLASKKVQT